MLTLQQPLFLHSLDYHHILEWLQTPRKHTHFRDRNPTSQMIGKTSLHILKPFFFFSKIILVSEGIFFFASFTFENPESTLVALVLFLWALVLLWCFPMLQSSSRPFEIQSIFDRCRRWIPWCRRVVEVFAHRISETPTVVRQWTKLRISKEFWRRRMFMQIRRLSKWRIWLHTSKLALSIDAIILQAEVVHQILLGGFLAEKSPRMRFGRYRVC